ncbi:MAG: CinA family nicotinamide mononucleotide deamidase-related protein [Planctomycetes bacterium]|nr:CinA family nicotinamide mononucleotide deamidase-related protein [Planctomycetota bacterium]
MINNLTCSILSIGDEILVGAIQDSNSSWLAQQISAQGFQVISMQICGDEQHSLETHISNAYESSDLVLISGGLGPTEDDRTRHAVAAVLGVELVHHDTAWKQIVAYYGKYYPQATISESNKRQALTPKGARLLKNDRGTAPGLLVKNTKSVIVCMPGVPHEMFAMAQRLIEQLPKIFPQRKVVHCEELYFTDLGESAAQDILGDLLESGKVQVGITAQELGYITIRVRGAKSSVQKHMRQIKKLLKAYLIPAAGLAASLIPILSKRSQTVTTAESCTCGHILTQLGSVSGASAILRQGSVVYHEQSKQDLMGVDVNIIKKHGVVSEEVATAMAEGAMALSGADYALASTGIAGPDGGSKKNPVGTVWIAVASKSGIATRELHIRGSRERVQRRAAADALRLLWKQL